ncbi:MAG: hypothetical protein MI861_21090 [Pirellulales bacterium]|nr:hypothetical protein [Pirellulales bacterium]
MSRSRPSRFPLRRALPLTLALVLCGWYTGSCRGNPSNTDPNRALAAHGTIEGAKELIASLYELYERAETQASQCQPLRANPARLPVRQIATFSGQIWKAQRDAAHLKLMGEPAGEDLSTKFTLLGMEFKKLGLLYRNSAPGSRYQLSLRKQLDGDAAKQQRLLQQAGNALRNGNLDSFETMMESYGVKLYEKLTFFTPVEANKFSSRFAAMLVNGDAKLSVKRRGDYFKIAQAKIHEHLASAQDFPRAAAQITKEIAATGSATLPDGTALEPPQAVAYLTELWGKSSAAIIRASALELVFAGSGNPPSSSSKINAELQWLNQEAGKYFVALVQAAAQSTAQPKVASTYGALLKELSVVDRRVGNHSISQACRDALRQLAAKDPALRIDAYERATSEVLKWRKRFAAQRAKILEREYPQSTVQLSAKAAVKATNKPEFFGSLSTSRRTTASEVFNVPANWQVFESASLLIDKPLSSRPLIRLQPNSPTAVVPHQNGHYLNVPVPLPAEAALANLKAALLVDPTHPPLSIAAADAISSAQRQDYQRVGGVIDRIHLEAAVTRFIGLPEVAYVLIPLGQLPALRDGKPPLTKTCWRLDVLPHWAQHDYFIVQISPSTR